MAKAAAKKAAAAKSLEQTLWEAADNHIVIGLVVLKYVSDAFEEHCL